MPPSGAAFWRAEIRMKYAPLPNRFRKGGSGGIRLSTGSAQPMDRLPEGARGKVTDDAESGDAVGARPKKPGLRW
jgi:hypothetical protein